MNKLSLLSSGLLLGVVVTLVGCGGGGGSSGPKPASSKPASSLAVSSSVSSSVESSSSSSVELSSSSSVELSSSSSVEPSSSSAESSMLSSSSLAPSSSSASSSSVPTTTQLEIHGMAVAEAVAGGEVSFVIGSHTYNAPINDQGQYQISLDIANADAGHPFTAIATGTASNDKAQIAALYPSVAKLQELAGDDGVLDATEYFGVNISPLTTAEYSIIMGNQLSINTDAERKYALLQIEAADELKRAAYISRYLADIGAGIPSGYETTLDLLLDKQYVDAQINISHQYYADDFASELLAIKADASQVNVSQNTMLGKFLLKTGSFTYLLILDEAHTGLLMTSNTPVAEIWANNGKYQQVFFTWERSGNNIQINLDTPISYGETSGFNSTFQAQCADDSSGINLPVCPVTLSSISISLIDDTEVGKIADVQLDVTVKDANDVTVFDVSDVNYSATLLDVSQFYKITEAELQGTTWFTNNYSYTFNADGTATQVNSYNKSESSARWRLDDGRVILYSDALEIMDALEILPIYPQGAGFAVMQMLIDNERALINGAYQQTPFIKRENVSMSSDDWVGRWKRGVDHSFSTASDFFENGQFSDGFETRLMGSWSAVSSTHVSGFSNGVWRMEYELLAIKDGKYYIQHCNGMSTDNFIPTSCALETYVIDKTFSGTTFWETWANPHFQNSDTGEYWQFWGHSLYLFNPSLYQSRSFIKVSPNLMLDSVNGKILEMLSSDPDSVEVCEYAVTSSCDAGESYTLMRSPEIKITISGTGSISYESREFQTSGSLMVRKEAKSLEVQPAAGYELLPGNIMGCDGVLNGINYDIPAPLADCEIVVTFTLIP